MSGLEPQNPSEQPAASNPDLALDLDASQAPLEADDLSGLVLEADDSGEAESEADGKVASLKAAKTARIKSKRHLERARRRQMSYLQERRKQKMRRVFYGRIRLLFKLCFAILWVILLSEIANAPFWNYDAPRYEMVNGRMLQEGQLQTYIEPLVGMPIYAIHTGKLANQLADDFAIIDRVTVRRHLFPARLEVIVQEKKPWARIFSSEKSTRPYALLSGREFIPLEPYVYDPALYRGQGLRNLLVTPRARMPLDYLDKLNTVSYQLQHLPNLHFRWMDARNPELITAHFEETDLILGRLDNTVSYRLARVVALIPKIHEFKDAVQAVDLRWDQQITFHKKPNAVIQLGEEEDPPQ